MTTPKQKAEVRPISFILHSLWDTQRKPTKLDLVVRPEDLTRSEQSRLMVHQTLGGAWADNWGPGVPTVQIAGTTGWGAGGRKDGLQEFIKLHDTIFSAWHKEREAALAAGFDPDMVKLIFCDDLDEFTWVVAPNSFVLRRNRARPLLSQYHIALTYLADGLADRKTAEELLKPPKAADADKAESALSSLDSALKTINSFVAKIKSAIGKVLGPIQKAFAAFTAMTAKVLGFVQGVLKAGMGIVKSITGPLLNIAGNLSRAAANIVHSIQAVMSFPSRIKAEFSRVASAFTNAFCVLKNAFKKRKFLPNYDDLYGASTCSSTAGGKPISRYNTENPFPVLMPVQTPAYSVSGDSAQAINRMANMDPVRNPSSPDQMNANLTAATNGFALNTSAMASYA